MNTTKRWDVRVLIEEEGELTQARAQLGTAEHPGLVGIGVARRNPDDSDVPRVGDELATSRALSDLAHKLLDVTVADIEANTHERAYLRA